MIVWAIDQLIIQAFIGRSYVRLYNVFYLSMLRPHRETLNQFRPSIPVWSKPLQQTFVKHVTKSTLLILRIFTSYYYNEFGQLEKFINYILSSGKLNNLYKKSPCLPVPNINNALTSTTHILYTILKSIYYKPSLPLAVLINKKGSLLKA